MNCTGDSSVCPESSPHAIGIKCKHCSARTECICDGKGFCVPKRDIDLVGHVTKDNHHYPTRTPLRIQHKRPHED